MRKPLGNRSRWEALPDIEGDPGLLKQVFVNAPRQCLQIHAPPGRGHMWMSARARSTVSVCFSVRDDGVGFDKQITPASCSAYFSECTAPRDFEGHRRRPRHRATHHPSAMAGASGPRRPSTRAQRLPLHHRETPTMIDNPDILLVEGQSPMT